MTSPEHRQSSTEPLEVIDDSIFPDPEDFPDAERWYEQIKAMMLELPVPHRQLAMIRLIEEAVEVDRVFFSQKNAEKTL
jgi:hypothetical protein